MAQDAAKTRVKGFDGVRGLGAVAVVFHHAWIADRNLGEVGVYLFFVLSGFLICGILHSARQGVDAHLSNLRTELVHFWINRGLRIFPLYYSTLLLAVLFGIALGTFQDLLHNFIWYVLYLQNFLIAFILKDFGTVGHTWTLAVEQQFYIIFGVLMLALPARRHMALLLIALVTALAGGFWTRNIGSPGTYVLPLFSFVPIICGGITSVTMSRMNIRLSQNSNSLLALVCCAALAGFAAVPENQTFLPHFYVFSIIGTSFFGSILYLEITKNQCGVVTKVLDATILRWLGSLSYGIYLIHGVVLQIALHFNMTNSLRTFAVVMIVTLALAQLSRLLIELPALRLKYKTKRPVPAFTGSSQTAA